MTEEVPVEKAEVEKKKRMKERRKGQDHYREETDLVLIRVMTRVESVLSFVSYVGRA